MIENIYTTNIQSETKINGLLSDPFTLVWGAWKGCPLSVLSYITAAEALAIFNDADTSIKGDHQIKQ